jgi:hypothetical protein
MSLPSKINPLYNPPPASQEQSYVVNFRPLGSIVGAKKFDFVSGKTSDSCIDLSKTELLLSFKLKDSDGKDLGDLAKDKKLGLCNNILGSFFSGLTVSINNQVVSQCSNQHYLDYITCMLNYPEGYKDTILTAAGWSTISADGVGSDVADAYTKSKDLVAKSATVTVRGKIHSPIFRQEKLLPPGVELSISLVQNDPKVILYTDLEKLPMIEIVDCQLSLRYIKLKPSLLTALTSSLNKNPYLINFARTEIRSFSLAKGLTSYSAHNIHFNKIPSSVIALFVPSANYQGDAAKSPYKFSNVNLIDHKFVYNGVAIPPIKLDYDMSGKKGVELYYHVCKQLGLDTAGPTPFYSYSMFTNDTFLLCQNFANDVSVSEQTIPGQSGTLGAEFTFSKALDENTTLLLISQFDDGLITIDNDLVVVS